MLAGPLLRRVEPNLVSVWVALKEPSTVKLALWDGHSIKSGSADSMPMPFTSGRDPAAQTLRIGQQFHVLVITRKLSPDKTLQPDQPYWHDLTLQTAFGVQTLSSLGLLRNDPPNATLNSASVKHHWGASQNLMLSTAPWTTGNICANRPPHGVMTDFGAPLVEVLADCSALHAHQPATPVSIPSCDTHGPARGGGGGLR